MYTVMSLVSVLDPLTHTTRIYPVTYELALRADGKPRLSEDGVSVLGLWTGENRNDGFESTEMALCWLRDNDVQVAWFAPGHQVAGRHNLPCSHWFVYDSLTEFATAIAVQTHAARAA